MAVAVTPDGQHFISGSWDKLVKVWSVASKSIVSDCAGHSEAVRAVAAMPDGQRILSGANDKTVRVWRLNGTLENTFEPHTYAVYAVALPGVQHALSASSDKTASSSTSTTAPCCAPSSTTQMCCAPWRCCRRPPLRQRLVDNNASIAYGLAPQ